MHNEHNVVAWGSIQHVAYDPFEYPDITKYIWCPCQCDYDLMQQCALDLSTVR